MRFRAVLSALPLMLLATTLIAQGSPGATAADDADKAIRTKLKSDLRNLVTAQEAYFAGHSAYADAIDNLKFKSSDGSRVSLVATQNNAWAAVASDESRPGRSCVIFVNLAERYRPKTAQEKRVGTTAEEGAPICDGDPKPER